MQAFKLINKIIFQATHFVLGVLFISCTVFGQSTMGGWTLHVPAKNANSVVLDGDMVYAAFDNGILAYDIDAKERSVMTSTNSLSDVRVTALGYEPNSKTVAIGYQNGNVDLLNGNSVFNLPAIKQAQIQGIKEIQKIKSYQGKVYLTTGFGVVVVDPIKQEVRDTYYPTENKELITDIEFSGDTVFVLTHNKVLFANKNSPGLGDFNQWANDTRVPLNSDNSYRHILHINNHLLISKIDVSYGNDSVYSITSGGLQFIDVDGFDLEIHSISNHNQKLAYNVAGGIFVMKSDFSGIDFIRNYYDQGEFPDMNYTVWRDGTIYIADKNAGLVILDGFGDFEKIGFSGPPKSSFYSLDWEDGKLLVTGGGLSGTFFTFNNSGFYLLEDQEWSLYNKESMAIWVDSLPIFDFVAASINPKNPDEFAMGTYSGVPLAIVNKAQTSTELYTNANSPLEPTILGNGWSYLSDIQYDSRGNLWVVNAYCDKTLKVLKEDGNWENFDMGGNSKNKITGKLAIDYNDNVWFAVEGRGLFALDYNETIDNLADDKKKQFQKGEGQGNLPSNSVRAIAVDFDNEIWVGTDAGFAIIYNSDNVFDASPGDFDAQRIKLDFEGNVEYLLGGTVINDIEVDGGNRKWIGTEGTGIFLMSADGITILENYTVENSPLISNVILDLEIDHNTGEVYCVTDIGLISFRTDASYEDPDYENVNVFPNPATPEFEGLITIQGIRYNSDVKITDIGGNLVYKTTSNGGTAVWNGKNLDGTKVASGVYLIWTAANEGKGRKVGKVVVIND